MDIANLEKLTNMCPVRYTVCNSLTPNATGYVARDKLQHWERGYDDSGEGEYTDADVLDGWIIVTTDDDEDYAVEESDMWADVWPEKALASGWGKSCPLGGTDDAKTPEAITDDGVYLIKWFW